MSTEAEEYGYSWEDWDMLPDETKDEIIAKADEELRAEHGTGRCGCMGGTE